MTARRFAICLAACLFVAPRAGAIGVAPDAFVDAQPHDLQFFAPVDFDLENQSIHRPSGLFFNYSRLAWTISGERTTIGAPGMVVDSEVTYVPGPFDMNVGNASPAYPIINGIQDSPPRAEWGWGHRYEFGYYEGGTGWLCEVLDGPRQTTSERYGFDEIEIPNTLPLVTGAAPSNGTGTAPILNITPALNPLLVGSGGINISGTSGGTGGGAGSGNEETARNGFGSIHVNFETPPGFLQGWRDYQVNGANNAGGPTTQGPGRVLTVTGAAASVVNGVVTAIQITGATVSKTTDGQVDNINGVGGDQSQTFYFVYQDTDGNGMFDAGEPILGTGLDQGDLHTFNVRFINLTVHNYTRTDGIEIMRTVDLDNSNLPVKEQRNHFDVAYGARFFQINDTFSWDGDMDTMGRSYQSTTAVNNIVGPQIRARWTHERQRLALDLDGRFVFGYNIQNLSQRGQLFEDALPGGVNRFVNAQPTGFAYGRQDNDFSPLVELRAQARYQLTGSLAARLGYTGIFIDNISRSSQLVRYRLPDLGILDGGNQNMFINGVDFGFEAVY